MTGSGEDDGVVSDVPDVTNVPLDEVAVRDGAGGHLLSVIRRVLAAAECDSYAAFGNTP